VNQNSPKILQLNLSGIGYWLTLLALVWLLGSIGLGWLVKSFFVLLGIIMVTPAIAFFAFRWWIKRNLVEDRCPVCGYEFTGFNRTEFQCPSCKEPLKTEKGQFQRLTPPGTIDVEAVEVSAQQLEDS
jgi:rubredoxin